MNEEEIQEVFKLFDQEGSGIKIKEIGMVMRSLGVAVSEAQLKEFVTEATSTGMKTVEFNTFHGMVKRAQTVQDVQSKDVATQMNSMKVGILHFFDKLPDKQIRDSPPATVKIADIKHLLSSVGEKMSEEEIEEMAREIRNTCQVDDGRVNFGDFVNMLQQ